ncbi:MAG: hypothetical protein NVS1B14_04180 [Vulcanimicrobiaceae bacterium]
MTDKKPTTAPPFSAPGAKTEEEIRGAIAHFERAAEGAVVFGDRDKAFLVAYVSTSCMDLLHWVLGDPCRFEMDCCEGDFIAQARKDRQRKPS